MKAILCTYVASAALATALAVPAAAQVTPAPAGPSAAPSSPTPENDQSADIIVTAQKRSERVNDVGMSITAVSGDTLVKRGVVDPSQLTKIEPSLQYSQSNNGTPVYTLRGVGYFEQSLSATPTVSLYQDEVAYPYSILSRGALLDLERVEVLKGPQGTLYGQNATGGAINFIAAKPTKTFSAGISETFARFSENLITGFISGPLTQTLSARLAGSYESGGAWQKSNTRDDKLGDKNLLIGRLMVDWKPSSAFSASLNLNGWIDRSETQAAQLVGVRFQAPQYISPVTPAQLALPATYLPNPAYLAGYPAPLQALVANPISPADPRAADWVPGTHPKADERFYQASLRLEYSLSDSIGITSLTSYQHFTADDQRDTGGVNVPVIQLQVTGNIESFSQELRLHGTLQDGRSNWIVGVNYSDDKNFEENCACNSIASATYLTGGSPYSVLPLRPFKDAINRNEVKTKAYSVFANIDYKLTENMVVNAGIRYTKSNLNSSGCSISSSPALNFYFGFVKGLLGGPGAAPVPGDCVTFGPDFSEGLQHERLYQDNIPWRVGLNWKIAPNQLLYASISQGYKAGTTPDISATSYIQRTPVTQESLLAYEAGFKLSLLDRQLQLNGAYFHYNYKNKQLLGRINDPIGVFGNLQALVNVPKSKEDGVELSATLRPASLSGLSLNAAVTYLDSRVTGNFLNYASYVTGPSDTVNFKGEAYPFTPKWSVNYGALYEWMLTGGVRAHVGGTGTYQSSTVAAFGAAKSNAEGPSLNIKGYATLDLSAGIESLNNHWKLEIWGRNVTNTYYWNSAFYGNDTTVRFAGQPATYGVTVGYRF